MRNPINWFVPGFLALLDAGYRFTMHYRIGQVPSPVRPYESTPTGRGSRITSAG
jgi:hypothetical protein